MTTTRRARAFLFLLVLGIAVNAGAYFLSARSVAGLRVQQHAQCKFDSDLGGAPVAAMPGGKPPLLGIEIVSDARVAWREAGCPGRLAPAAPSFTRWARYYHQPLN